jgi:hypothetical protein
VDVEPHGELEYTMRRDGIESTLVDANKEEDNEEYDDPALMVAAKVEPEDASDSYIK